MNLDEFLFQQVKSTIQIITFIVQVSGLKNPVGPASAPLFNNIFWLV